MELFNIYTSRENNPEIPDFRVLAENHIQHIWNETMLQGVSASGSKKLDAASEHCLWLLLDGRYVRLKSWSR